MLYKTFWICDSNLLHQPSRFSILSIKFQRNNMKRIFLLMTFVVINALFASDKIIELDAEANELQEKITNLTELKRLSSEK